MTFELDGKRIWVAGHRGMVGAALCRRLAPENCQVITAPRDKLDLREQQDVTRWMDANRPDVIVIAAARVGGILANQLYPADFIYDNIMISANIINAARAFGTSKLLYIGSSATYPELAPQPLREEYLMTGPLETSHVAYATAKIAGIRLCQAYRDQHGCDFIVAQPTNLYGPGDNYSPESSHVVPALIRKFHEAKLNGDTRVMLWGSGTPLRDFLHADDLADALVFLLKNYSQRSPINIGSGREISIRQLSAAVARATKFDAEIAFDPTKPDGAARRLMDSSRLTDMGWTGARDIDAGLTSTYEAWLLGR